MSYKLNWGNPKQDDFNSILDAYSNTSVNSNYTSSIPLAQYWKQTEKVLQNLSRSLHLKGKENNVYFEYPAPSVGNAKSSMSDVMLITGNEKVAIEVKFTEVNENYESIKDWYSRVKTGNKVLPHWVEILKPFIKNPDSISKDSEIPYQFLHRTASACYVNNERAICLYQIFVSEETEENYKSFVENLSSSIAELNPHDNLEFYIQKIHVIPRDLKRDLQKDDNFFGQIKNGEQLFSFGEEIFYKYNAEENKFIHCEN